MVLTKVCTKCGLEKPRTDFVPRKTHSENSVRSECKVCGVAARKDWGRRNPVKVMIQSARRRAKDRNCVFSLVDADIVIPDVCPILGIVLSKEPYTNHPADDSPSLDKIDPDKGYVRGNVVVISQRANRAKSDLSLEELKKLVAFLEGLALPV